MSAPMYAKGRIRHRAQCNSRIQQVRKHFGSAKLARCGGWGPAGAGNLGQKLGTTSTNRIFPMPRDNDLRIVSPHDSGGSTRFRLTKLSKLSRRANPSCSLSKTHANDS